MRRVKQIGIGILGMILMLTMFGGCMQIETPSVNPVSLDSIPPYSGDAYVILNNNQPQFENEDLTVPGHEYYAPLDIFGRCQTAMACLGLETMPTEERGNIGMVKPSGWQTIKFDFVDGKYLYNRCHLIGFQLSGENANESNLITGTRYMNVEGMLPFENMVADYIKETGNHVKYRVTPIYEQDHHLVASGVTMEAYSIEDNGEGICFYVYCYNVQPGVSIDYASGNATLAEQTENAPSSTDESGHYILNTNSRKIHKEDCSSAKTMNDKNRKEYDGDIASLLQQGYETAGCCFD